MCQVTVVHLWKIMSQVIYIRYWIANAQKIKDSYFSVLLTEEFKRDFQLIYLYRCFHRSINRSIV